MPDAIATFVGGLQGWLFEHAVLPLLAAIGALRYTDDAFNGTEELVLGVLEIAILMAVLIPLERLLPYERPHGPSRAVRIDVLYTMLHRLGLFPLFFFFTFRPLFDALQAWLHLHGVPTFGLESLVPALDGHPLLAFAAYLVVLDFAQYWIHRGQHGIGWWWALHAVHHSQQRMTFWTDNRNHLLDSVMTDAIFAAIALVIGVPPGQFALLVVLSRMVESVSHANVRLPFGRLGERLLVGPLFHRWHHAVAASPRGAYRGANYAVLFPVWDVLFGTADFTREPGPTGIDDQAAGRDYGEGFWRQQWLGLRRMVGRDVRPGA
jgi:sterol desaturase/sphingolipid hydroxylase (fatty acid hydroxylase superfamily)